MLLLLKLALKAHKVLINAYYSHFIYFSASTIIASISMDKWQNKVAMVTGASAGIGVDICKSLVESGMLVSIRDNLWYW